VRASPQVIRSSEELQANDPSLQHLTPTTAAAETDSTNSQGVGQAGVSEEEEEEEEGAVGGEGVPASSLGERGSGFSGYHPEWGNYGDDSRGECGVAFAQRFHMPEKFGGNGNFW